jgi:FtsH-binding integral membrane protein
MKFPTPLFLGAYKLSLHLYPHAFRQRYAEQLIDAARLQQAEATNDLPLTASLAWDTLHSALREHARAATPSRPGYVAAFALFFSVLLLATSVVNQQILRRGADRRPSFIAQFIARRSPQDPSIAATLNAPKQEISSEAWLASATPFVALYDASGTALAANATLNGALPQPPRGIFNTIRDRREFRVTWQPRVGIRVALTGDVLPTGGFVVAGQSLILAESKEIRFHSILLWMWAFAMLACCALVLFARKPARTPTA